MIQVFYENKEYANNIEYAFKVLGNCCGQKVIFISNEQELLTCKDEALTVTYGKKMIPLKKSVHIYEADLFSNTMYLKHKSMPHYPAYRYEGMPIFFVSSVQKEDIEVVDMHVATKLDIIQSIFFILSNYEEQIQTEDILYDEHGRLKLENRTLYKEEYFDRPIVNDYSRFFCKLSERIGVKGLWNVPRHMSAHVSHDVDYPYEITLGDRLQILLFGRILGLPVKRIISSGSETISTIEKENDIVSSWYFKGGGKSKYDDRYKITNGRILEFVSELKEQGCEIGFHYSYAASEDEGLAKRESELVKKSLDIDYLCGRNHFLRCKSAKSWKIYEKIGIVYDTTQGCAECEGFMNGICIPYKLFDVQNNCELNVWEIPLLVMDGTLRRETYRNYTADEALDRINELLKVVLEFSGVFTILWHNTSIHGKYWEDWFEEVYKPTMKVIGRVYRCSMKGTDIINKYNMNE